MPQAQGAGSRGSSGILQALRRCTDSGSAWSGDGGTARTGQAGGDTGMHSAEGRIENLARPFDHRGAACRESGGPEAVAAPEFAARRLPGQDDPQLRVAHASLRGNLVQCGRTPRSARGTDHDFSHGLFPLLGVHPLPGKAATEAEGRFLTAYLTRMSPTDTES